MRALPVFLALLISANALAQPYDSLVTGTSGGCTIVLPIYHLTAEWIGGPGRADLLDVIAVAPAPGGRIYALVQPGGFGPQFYVAEIRSDGTRVPLTPAVNNAHAVALVVDQAGAVYVLYEPGEAGISHGILAFDPDGSQRASYPLGGVYAYLDAEAFASTAMDLAADQCTLYVIQNGMVIRRFDVCNGGFLADFATVQNAPARALRILPDGGVLVSTGPYGNERLDRYDASGVLVRSYPLAGPVHAMMLRSGGSRISYGEFDCFPGHLRLMELDTGIIESTFNFDFIHTPTTIVSYFGWTAAIGDAHPAQVPATGPMTLLVIGLMIAAAAVIRLR